MMLLKIARISAAILITLLCTSLTGWSRGGTTVGNGGDDLRHTFIHVGGRVIDYLNETNHGRELVNRFHLDQVLLQQTLSVDRITVIDEIIIDNTGSIVDARGEPGGILLSKTPWEKYFSTDRDVAYLIFHEMLRSAGFDDDQYIISRAIFPFPLEYRISTRVQDPDDEELDSPPLSKILGNFSIEFSGAGCEENSVESEVKNSSNSMLLFFRKFDLMKIPLVPHFASKRCVVKIPVTPPTGYRLVLTQVDTEWTYRLGPHQAVFFYLAPKFSSQTEEAKRYSVIKYEKSGKHLSRIVTQDVASKCGEADTLEIDPLANARGFSPSSVAAAVTEKGKPPLLSLQKLNLFFSVSSCGK